MYNVEYCSQNLSTKRRVRVLFETFSLNGVINLDALTHSPPESLVVTLTENRAHSFSLVVFFFDHANK